MKDRPPEKRRDSRTILNIEMTPELREGLRKLAKRRQHTMSSYMRRVIELLVSEGMADRLPI